MLLLLFFLALASAQLGCDSSSGGDRGDDAGAIPDAASDASDASNAYEDQGDASTDASKDASEVEEPMGKSCADPIPLSNDESGAEIRYALEALGSLEGSCGGEGPETIFTFTLTERSLYSITLSGEAVDGVLFVREACDEAASELACHDGFDADAISGELDAGTYYLFADAYAPIATGTNELSWKFERHPCLDVQCGGEASCELAEDGQTPRCACAEGLIYDGTTCIPHPCASDPCSIEQGMECVYSSETLPGHACVPRAWTLLIYISADNDLWREAQVNIEEMRLASLKAGPQGTVTLVVLADGPAQGDTQLARIRHGVVETLDTSETFLQGRDELDMADAATLRDFGVWGLQTYQAQNLGLLVWDHGSGWRSLRLEGSASPQEALTLTFLPPSLPHSGRGGSRGFSNDFSDNPEDRSREISISSGEYGEALAAMTAVSGRAFDLIAFDACEMGLYEVANASAPYAEYFLASEDRIPARGFPYLKFLSALFADETLPLLDLSQMLIDAYAEASTYNYTLSITDLSTFAALDAALDALASALLADMSDTAHLQAIAQARAQTLRFYEQTHRDLGDFAERLLANEGVSPEVRAAASALRAQLAASVLYAAAQESHEDATGLAIYFPDPVTGLDAAYVSESAPWNQASRWSAFLAAYTQAEHAAEFGLDAPGD
jgi:hypothetical protein